MAELSREYYSSSLDNIRQELSDAGADSKNFDFMIVEDYVDYLETELALAGKEVDELHACKTICEIIGFDYKQTLTIQDINRLKDIKELLEKDVIA